MSDQPSVDKAVVHRTAAKCVEHLPEVDLYSRLRQVLSLGCKEVRILGDHNDSGLYRLEYKTKFKRVIGYDYSLGKDSSVEVHAHFEGGVLYVDHVKTFAAF